MPFRVDVVDVVDGESVGEDSFEDFAYAVYFAAGERTHETEDCGAIVGKDELVVGFVFVGADFCQ